MSDPDKAVERSVPVMSTGDVLRVTGPVSDDTLLAVLKCEPTLAELDAAAAGLRGATSGRARMTGKVAMVYDILRADALYADGSR